MNTADTTFITRTNQRDCAAYTLAVSDGSPCCPHCSAPMTRTADAFENSSCRCWWHGSNDAVYALQVVIAATDELEAEYLARVAARNAECRAEAKAAAERFTAAAALIVELGGTVRVSAKKSRGRGGKTWADMPRALEGDPRLASIPTGYGANFFAGINFIDAAQ